MQLKKIELSNYRQHKDLTVSFDGNLIAVCGANGSGKSNFLGAIQFALTGEQPGFNKEDLLSWGEESGYVELWFSHGGKQCQIQRRIESPGCLLRVDGEKFTGAKKVAEALSTVVGVDKEVLRQSVFVRQTEVESCLFTDPRERELNFQRLLGLGDAAKLNKQLGDIIIGLGDPQSFEEAISSTQDILERANKTKTETAAKLEKAKAALSRWPTRFEIDAEIRDAISEQHRLDELKKCATLLSEQEATFRAVVAENSAIAKQERPDVNGLHDRLAACRRKLQLAKSLARTAESMGQAEAEVAKLSEVEDQSSALEALKIEGTTAHERMNKAKGELAALAKLKEACRVSDGKTCPLCGSATGHDIGKELDDRSTVLKKAIADAEADYNKKLEVYSQISKAVQNHKLELSKATLFYEKLKAELDALFAQPDCSPDLDEAALAKEIDDLVLRSGAATDICVRLDQAKAEIEGAKTRLETARAMARNSGFDPDEKFDETDWKEKKTFLAGVLAQAEEKRKAREALDTEVAVLESSLLAVSTQLSESARLLEDFKEKQRRNDVFRKKLSVLTDVKDWFNYKNGPRVLTRNVMSALTESVNHYLDKFGSPFTVEAASEGMGFLVHFCDGRYVPDPLPDATMLSGGQRIALAVAFRFAVYTLFSDKLGLLSLDEPTAYLDAATIGRFGDLLQKISQIAKNSGLQVLMATHEASLAGVFDQTITIGS